MGSTELRAQQTGGAGAQPAGLLRRGAAALADVVILVPVLLALEKSCLRAGRYTSQPNEVLLLYPVAGVAVLLGYKFLFLAAVGRTPGMLALGLAVTSSYGDRISAAQAAVRTLVSWLSAAPFGLGYAWALFHPRRQTWHDLAAGTVVIRGSPAAARRRARPLRRSPAGPRVYRIN